MPTATLLDPGVLDPSARFTVSYGALVNVATFQQSGLLHYGQAQYAAWYTSTGHLRLGRRVTEWEVLELPYALASINAHKVISLGVSPVDGRIHVAYGTHDSAINYLRSVEGLADGGVWEAAAFGSLMNDLNGVDPGPITYPRFITQPSGKMLLSFRVGTSGSGRQSLAEYDGTWTLLGDWSQNLGNTTINGYTSSSRNLYLHGIRYDTAGRLHASGCWREGNQSVALSSGGIPNHDVLYVYSDDHGRTWHNDAGTQLAETGTTSLVAVGQSGLIVDPMLPQYAYINSESMATDSQGRPHIAISYVPGRFVQSPPYVTDATAQRTSHGRVMHVRKTPAGTWQKTEIKNSGVDMPLAAPGRSQIVLDSADNAYMVLPKLRIMAATPPDYSDWSLIYDGTWLGAFGECLVDLRGDVLSVAYQAISTGTTPSAWCVRDFQLGV